MSDEGGGSLDLILETLRVAPYDEAAWRVLYREFWPYVVVVIGKTLRGYDDSVQDLAQEVFMRLLRAGPMADFTSPDALRAYVRIISINVARRHLRLNTREAALLHEVPLEAMLANTPAPSIESGARLSATLRSALTSLSESDRQLLQLMVDGFSIGEIAEQLGVTYGTAGVRIHRLRRKLAKALE